MLSLPIILRCDPGIAAKAAYVLDSLLLAIGVRCHYVTEPPDDGVWLLYGNRRQESAPDNRSIWILHDPEAWRFVTAAVNVDSFEVVDRVPVLLRGGALGEPVAGAVTVDILANAFFLLASWYERRLRQDEGSRGTFAKSIFATSGIPQDAVDQYLCRMQQAIREVFSETSQTLQREAVFPGGAPYAVVLTHDIDFLPRSPFDSFVQAVKTFARHTLRERRPAQAVRAASAYVRATRAGRDPFGCIPEILAEERRRGVRSSFQVAVANRHPADVRYRVDEVATREYLRTILKEGFEVGLHGSYRSTEDMEWYLGEVETLAAHLVRPMGSRQHFLSFDYDNLFAAQEQAGIEYDMSIGFPDHIGSRAGFSHPYFPYCIEQDRPYRVLQIGLALMDVTLRSYMRLSTPDAWDAIRKYVDRLRATGGCVSVDWHPIVFGNARDPGSADLYWRLADYVKSTGGLATDGRTISSHVRARACSYASFGALTNGGR